MHRQLEHMKMKQKCFVLCLLAFFSLFSSAAEPKISRRVLFLNLGSSKSAPYYEILKQCGYVLNMHNVRFQSQYENLEIYLPNAGIEEIALKMGHILQSLRNKEYDLIVPLGQGAVDALAAYSSYLPDELAVIPVGIGIDVSRLSKLHRNLSTVACEASEEKCLELIFNILPRTESVFFVAGNSAESQASKERMRKLQPRYPKLRCLYPDNGVSTLGEVADQIEISGRNTVVILENWNSNGKDLLELDMFLQRLSKMRSKVFTITDGIYTNDFLGGAIVKPQDVGMALGNEIRDALRRGNVCTGEEQFIHARSFVNCLAMDKFGFSTENLPLGVRSIGLNEMLDKHHADSIRLIIWCSALMFVLLLVAAFRIAKGHRFIKRAKALLSLLPARIMISDINGKVYVLHYYGYLHLFRFGKRFEELPVVVPGDLQARARAVIESNDDYVCTKEIDGRIYKVELIYMPRNLIGYEAVLWNLGDITDFAIDSKHTRRYAQAKSNFVAIVSHELRLFLDAIIGHSELLQKNNLTEDVKKEYIGHIYAAAKSLNGLIDETTYLTRVENHTLESHPEIVDLNEITSDVTKVFSKLASDKGIYLNFEPVPDLPHVLIDGVHLRQILSIIVNNAVKYTEQGGAIVRIKQSPSQNVNSINVAWEIEDTGIGIEENEKRGIFEPFEHGNIESKLRKMHGKYGLGLPVARSLARYIGGNVTFVSTKFKGSVFSVTFKSLPVAVVEENKTEEHLNKVFTKAFVVEENAVTRNMLASMLRGLGMEVRDASSGHECLKALENFSADIIFTEYVMADMTGDELAQKIHCSPKSFNAKVIAVTADVMCADKSGDVFDSIVYKPVTNAKLSSLLKNL